jgi:chorismate mutase
MMSEQTESEIIEINERIDELDDPRAQYALLKERINTYRSRGDAVPDALKRMERSLMQECLQESQGR